MTDQLLGVLYEPREFGRKYPFLSEGKKSDIKISIATFVKSGTYLR